MQATTPIDETQQRDITRRLRSIEGQARGIQRMLAEQRDCQEIIDQLAALRAATHAVTMEAVEAYASQCLRSAGDDPERVVAQLFTIVARLTR